MCIILYKPAITELPDIQTLQTCFNNNHHGAGFMYQFDNEVHIQKGFMTFESLILALDQLRQKIDITEVPLVIHFRLASHGKINQSNCHPFPITKINNQLKSKYCITDLAVVHNGIIPFCSYDRNISDTIIFTRDYLTEIKDSLFNPVITELILQSTKSKFIIMSSDNIQLIGEFIHDEIDNCYYSNNGYIDYYRYEDEEEYNFKLYQV